MPTLFFVDTDPGVVEAWGQTPHNKTYLAFSFAPFLAVTETAKLVASLRPDIVVIAPCLGEIRGMVVLVHLRKHQFSGSVVINAVMGGRTGKNSDIPCTPDQLRKLLDRCCALNSREAISAPDRALPKATIDIDGWVQCPNLYEGQKCEQWINVYGFGGEKTCTLCHNKFVALERPNAWPQRMRDYRL